MKFGPTPVDRAEGAILAHRTNLPGRVLKKGHVLAADDIAMLCEAGVESVFAARLEEGDLTEDEAAAALAQALAGPGVTVAPAFTGRGNLMADTDGVVVFERARLDEINSVDEAITVATAPAFEVVREGQMVATAKIIPFAVAGRLVDQVVARATEGEPLIRVAPFREKAAGLVLTRIPGMKERILDTTSKTASARLAAFGSNIAREIRCDHDQAEIASALSELQAAGCDPIFIFGASATVDRGDLAPAALVDAGGRIDHFGMPVDPGNLLFLGSLGAVPVVGMPGCARSPKINGFDWVLWRLLADLAVTPKDLMAMGAGGLLKEISERGQLRAATKDDPEDSVGARAPRIAAVLLAAGSSRRMGADNKLTQKVGDAAMVLLAAKAILESQAAPLIVVTGHDADSVRAALGGMDVQFVHNPDYGDGLSGSLRAGLAALAEDADGAIVCLGDMPRVTAAHIDILIRAFDPTEGRAICVPVFGRKRGNPVLWSRRYFAEMAGLDGDMGARHLLEEHSDQLFETAMPDDGVLVDVDTPERLRELRQRMTDPADE